MIKLQHTYEMFICDRETFCSKKTILFYRDNISSFLSYVENITGVSSEDLDINDVPDKILSDYLRHLRKRKRFENHHLASPTNLPLKNTSVRTYCRAVKAYLNYCNSEFDTYFHTKIKMPKDDSEEKIPLYETEVEQIDRLFHLKTMTGCRNYCIFHLMLDCGLRAGEVVSLRICDVLFDKNVIRIHNSKGNKSRMILLPSKLKKQLYLYLYMFRNYQHSKDYDMQPFFTKLRNDGFLNYNCIKQMIRKIKTTTNINRMTPHLLRHTFATSYIMGGGNMENLRLLLGHFDYSITREYLHLANTYALMGASIYKLDPIYFKSGY